MSDGTFTKQNTAITTPTGDAAAVDYGASTTGTIPTFTVVIAEGTSTSDATITVYPQDTGASGGTFNKAGSSTGD